MKKELLEHLIQKAKKALAEEYLELRVLEEALRPIDITRLRNDAKEIGSRFNSTKPVLKIDSKLNATKYSPSGKTLSHIFGRSPGTEIPKNLSKWELLDWLRSLNPPPKLFEPDHASLPPDYHLPARISMNKTTLGKTLKSGIKKNYKKSDRLVNGGFTDDPTKLSLSGFRSMLKGDLDYMRRSGKSEEEIKKYAKKMLIDYKLNNWEKFRLPKDYSRINS
jgi:hypothetical protein